MDYSRGSRKLSKSGLIAYYTNMLPNVILGAGLMIGAIINSNLVYIMISALWLISPIIMNYISIPIKQKKKFDELDKQEQEYIIEIGKNVAIF